MGRSPKNEQQARRPRGLGTAAKPRDSGAQIGRRLSFDSRQQFRHKAHLPLPYCASCVNRKCSVRNAKSAFHSNYRSTSVHWPDQSVEDIAVDFVIVSPVPPMVGEPSKDKEIEEGQLYS